MSVNSRFQQKVQFQRPNPQTTVPNQTNSAKLFTCPKCLRLYDYQLRGNVYVGRVPLILNCEHTICEECVRQTFMKKDVVCGECHTTSPLPWGDLKKKFQELFPVNYYLFGLLSYSKSNGYDISNVSFKPVNRSKFSPFEVKAEVHTPNMTQECSQRNCQRPAQVHCSECDEVYCDSCSDTLHKSARGLMKHKINPLNLLYYPELKTYCNRHKEALLEFHCETCVEYMCCYCIIEDHKDHEYVRVTQLKEEEIPAFKTLVDAAEEMLRKLKATEKKCNQLLSTHSSSPTNNSIDTLISRCFENLHAALQILEKDLRKDADTYKNINYDTLKSILGEVTTSCHSLSQLIQSAREVIDSKHQVNKLNVKVIKDLLQNSLKVPCFIVTEKQSSQNIEFICGNLLNDLKDNFSIKSDKKCPYYLVAADDLPTDYDTEEVSDTGSSSMFSLGVTSQTGSSGLENALEKWNQHAKPFNKKKESIESWLKNTRDSKELRDVEMPILKKADRMSVVVTHINSPECFYVHLRKMSSVLNKFSKNIDVYIKSFPPNANDPDIGNLYIVKYATKSNIQWCRGRIIDKNEKGLYTAFFVDYGNTATNIRKQDIKTISPELQIPTPFALECKLFDLYPVRHKWDPNVMNIMAHIISSNNLLMIVMDNVNNLLEVDILAIDGDTSLRDALKFMGYGRPYMTTPTELDLIKEEFRTIHDMQLQKHNENFKKEDSMMVVIKYVINPFNIYVNMCHSQSLFNNLKEAMQKFYTEHKKGYIYTPKKDMVVAVLNNDTWFRGIILEATEGRGLVIVYLVDIGNTISVAWQYMRKLNESFIALECQAILVKLAHISPPNNTSNWSQSSIDYFNRFIETGATLKMTVYATGKPIEIALFECFPSMNVCINAILVQEQLAESTGILSTTVEWPEYLKEMQQTETKSFTLEMMKTIQSSLSQQSLDLVEDSDEEQLENVVRKPVEVISAENPNLIYVRLVDKKREQHEFNLKLQNYYSKRCLDKSDWNSGDVCVVFHEKQYYRAIVLEALPRDHFRVSLRDVVVEMVVSKNNMGVLHDEFKVFHEFAVRCHLAGINPAGGTKKWPAITCEFLQDTFKNQQQFLLAKNGILDKDNKSLPVTMWYTEFIPGGPLESSKTILHSINKLLLSNGLALKTREPQKEIVKYVPEEKSPKQEIPPDVKVDWIELLEEEKNKKVVLQEPKDWLPCIPFKEKNFFATPTFVNNEGEIYLHETIYDTLLSNMESKMGDSFKDTEPEPVVWTVGQLCTAKYFLNGNWYRGKIIENNGNSMKVLMIDYGNEEDCVPDDLRTTLLFEDVPAFANRVRLNNVYPKHGKWQTSDLDRLHAQVVDKNINAVLTETPILGKATPAVLYLGITNVNELMLKNSSNLSHEVVHYPKMPHVLQDVNDLSNNNKFNDDAALDTQQMNDSLSDSDVIIEEENYVMSQDEEATADDSVDMIEEVNVQELVQFEMNEIEDDNLTYVQADLPKLSEGEKLQVGIINFVTYNKVIFECSSPENCEKEKFLFEVISNEIKNEAALQPVLENLQVGMPCVAQFSDDGEWYRAKIFDIDDDLINVWFVDFGNFEDVPIGLIRNTKPSWLKVPLEHHLATVSDIQLADESNLEMVLDNMSSYYNTIKRVEIVSRQPLSVRIYDRDTEQLSYKNLLDDGLLTHM